MLRKFIGKLLKEMRKERGYSLKEIAKYCRKSVSDLSRLEKGKIKNPSIFLILNYLKTINIHYGEFFSKIQGYEIENLLKMKEKAKIVNGMGLVRKEIRYSLGLKFQKKPFINYPEELEWKIKNYLLPFGYEPSIVRKYIKFSEKVFYGLLDGKDENYFQEINKKAEEENLDKLLLAKIAKITYEAYKRALKRINQVKPITDKKMKRMAEGYLKYWSKWIRLEYLIKKYLCEKGVPLPLHFYYLNKAKKYHKLLKKNRLEKIKEIDEKAIKEGLEKEILEKIKEIIKERDK
ncbi:MAG: helix-turn-helix transcriptional regulator [candidate division WOR-3 bacterium]